MKVFTNQIFKKKDIILTIVIIFIIMNFNETIFKNQKFISYLLVVYEHKKTGIGFIKKFFKFPKIEKSFTPKNEYRNYDDFESYVDTFLE